jgi:hypothetical protein
MAGTVVNLALLGFLFLLAFLCLVAPVTLLAFMFWNWHKELAEMNRLKQAKSTQVR